MTTNGVDYAWSRPSPAALERAGISFACRYLATDRSKALSATEAKALAAVGIWSVVVWETTAKRMLTGKAGGVADAKSAAFQAKACGMPADRPIYFAADWDATEAQQAQINAYLDGAASVLGRARVGIYGGYYPVRRALDAGKAVWAWQTRAWSGGHWDPRAHIRQGAYVTIGGVQCDANTAMQADFGQWMPGRTPDIQEDTVQISDEDVQRIARQVVTGAAGMHAPDDRAVDWALSSWVQDIHAKVTALEKAQAPEIDYARLAAALIAAVTGANHPTP